MWDKIKKLFDTKPETAKELISLDRLDFWFEEKKKRKLNNANNIFSETKQVISQTKAELKDNIETLRSAELLNQDIPERAKHFANGNRKELLRRTETLNNSIIFPDSVETLAELLPDFEKRIRDFAEGTKRPIQILDEFFSKETRAILSNIAVIEKSINKNKKNLEICKDVLQIKSVIEDIKASIENKSRTKQTIKERNEELEKINSDLFDANGKKEELELSEEFKDYNTKKETLQSINAKIKETKDAFTNSFAIIESALKKYSHITFEKIKLLPVYIEDPIEAFIEDKDMKILKIIDGMKKAINDNSIKLKDKKKEKVLKELDDMNLEFFNTFTKAYGLMKKDEKELVRVLMDAKVIKEIKEIQKRIDDFEGKEERIKENIRSLREDIEKYDSEISEKTGVLKQKANDFFNVDLTLTF